MSETSWKDALPLGKNTEYVSVYTPSLLKKIPRSISRVDLGLSNNAELPFLGTDLWTAYELSWLDMRGKPMVAMAQFQVPCHSDFIIESKSLKLYLNSFNQSKFESSTEVVNMIEVDLSACANFPVLVDLHSLAAYESEGFGHFIGECIDHIETTIEKYHPDANLLRLCSSEAEVKETLHSHLLKTNCPVTSQPDWASVMIKYVGPKIDRESLLKYIVSYREYSDFHEHCIEKIYMDILTYCKSTELTVYGRFTRRGGLDINPYRSSNKGVPDRLRLVRQ